ncbi:PadR family transcriptional regulator [Amycolatopsis cihanbeyliensis]|uniref:PadR family transcriptional regulator n=1 Tax=Amycolatopsis cihanbeyliensis TaxID=1128664 RepID=A0A542DQL0_AMYCI|nr:helix-turn-helix transcriptional regulator [Amycolatopsis cihanbeyliensis]TQJ05390.1 PadR family transcriptional regulator [Amycolatopsis cihanbeyliensis]
MSATRLLVLGVVRMYGKAHGYQVRRELQTWSADKWANIQPGSIYHALKKMTTEGLLEQVETEQGGSGPERVAYRITETGEAEFQILIAQALARPSATGFELPAALVLLTTQPRQRLIGLLKQQLIRLEGDEESSRLLLEEGTSWGHPAHVTELYRLWQRTAEARASWLRELIERLRAGEYVLADDSDHAFGEPGGAE